jgi:hypothetical protein
LYADVGSAAVQAWQSVIDTVKNRPGACNLTKNMAALFQEGELVQRSAVLAEAVSTTGVRQNDIATSLGLPSSITPFSDQEIRQLKVMLFNPIYLKTQWAKELAKRVMNQQLGNVNESLIRFFSGLLPGAGRVANVSKLTDQYDWNMMAEHYNIVYFQQAFMSGRSEVSFPALPGLAAVTLQCVDMGAKEARIVRAAAIGLAKGMVIKHTRIADQHIANAAGPIRQREHASRVAAVMQTAQPSLEESQTAQSQPTHFPGGSIANGIPLGMAASVPACLVNHEVIAPPTAQEVAAGKQKKKSAPKLSVNCPLCNMTLTGHTKLKNDHATGRCGFGLLVAKFKLSKVHGVSKTRAQCGWIALQDSTWLKKVVGALKREKKGTSKVSNENNTVTETLNAGGFKDFGCQRKLKAADICKWDLVTNVNSDCAVAVSLDRVRQRTESLASNRGDTRSGRSDA